MTRLKTEIGKLGKRREISKWVLGLEIRNFTWHKLLGEQVGFDSYSHLFRNPRFGSFSVFNRLAKDKFLLGRHRKVPIFDNTVVAKFRNFCYSEQVTQKQRIHKISPITVNGIKIVQVIIDAHYEKKHHTYMSDDLILKLVLELDGRQELPETITSRYSYFATLIEFGEKKYRLIWLLEDHAIYIGVVNAYRDGRRS